jgi:GT2 family glycosyltransferase/glycosyltransferase involved in cell wall biosynthesis
MNDTPAFGEPGAARAVRDAARGAAEERALATLALLREVSRQAEAARRVDVRRRSVAERARAMARRLRRPGLAKLIGLIRRSGAFDVGWYLSSDPAIEATGTDPILHYVLHGWREGRDPNPFFSVTRYLRANPDVASEGVEPLSHYLLHGAADGREPHPVFHGRWYLERYPDVAAAGFNPLAHFVSHGAAERRDPHPLFDSAWYIGSNPDVAVAGVNPLLHYVLRGAAEGRDPHPVFSTAWYLERNSDAAHSGVNALEHYLATGRHRGALPGPGVTRGQCEQLLGATAADRSGHASLAQRPWAFPAALQRLLDMVYQADAAAPIIALYDVLGRHGGRRLSEAELRAAPELQRLVDEVTELSRAIALPTRIDATVVIPVRNQVVHTLCCLKALLGSPARSSFEIIVADDLSDDATASVIGQLGGIIRHHRNAIHLGRTQTRNAAAALARGDMIAFLDSDTIPLPHWLDELVTSLRADPSIGPIGSKLLNSDGSLQAAGGIVWQDGSRRSYGQGGDARAPAFNYVKDVDDVGGTAFALRKSVWDELKGFDEVYASDDDADADLAFRVHQLGLRTVYQPFSAVIHHEGSDGRALAAEGDGSWAEARQLFVQRWKDVLARENLPRGADVPLARDRSRGRGRILVIDHYVPQPDRDAGSRSMDHYLRLFRTSGLHVSVWPLDRHFDRAYAQPLQRLGIEILYNPDHRDTFDEWIAENGRYLDYAFLSRAGVAIYFIEKVRARTRAKILFFGHDIHFRRLELEFAVTGNPAIDRERAGFAQMERAVWDKCDVIYYFSDEECEFVRGEYPAKVVRTVPLFIYSDAGTRQARERLMAHGVPATRQLLFVGGFRHRPNVDGMLWFTREVWPVIVAAVPHASLGIAGSFPPPEIEALADDTITVTGAISDGVLRQLYLSSQVAIVPLRFGGGVKGKLLEALSYGTPIVTTSIGVQGVPGVPALVDVCDAAENFAAAVIGILKDPGSRLPRVLGGLDLIQATASEAAARRVLGQDVPQLAQSEPCHGKLPTMVAQ